VESFVVILVYVVVLFGFGFKSWLSWLNYQNRNAEIPEEVNDIYDEKDYKRWLDYTMEKFKLNSIMRVFNTIVFLAFLIFGVFVIFDDAAKELFTNNRLQILAFMGIYYVVNLVLEIYPDYYNTFTIEEKYGFNKTNKKTFVLDLLKKLLLTVIFGGGLLYLVVVLEERTGNMFFVYTWLALVVIILISFMIYASVIVPIFNKLTPLEDGELKDEINKFAKKVGYEVSKISVMDASRRSSKLNAFFSGFGKFKKIVLYDTLIEKCSTEEIVAVLAHEIGHNKHKHMFFNLGQTALTFLLYIGLFGFLVKSAVFSTAFGFDTINFGFSVILFTVLIEPLDIIFGLVTAGFSRKHEFQADRFAAINYAKEPIESSLKVLSRENFSNLTPHPLYVKLLYSHPTTVERIRAIKGIEVK
jgi:STE24 endopeptidase